jgi:hypothetical protein
VAEKNGDLVMSQAERDRLVCLKKANKKLITRAAAEAELKVSERPGYRLLAALKVKGDSAVVHGLRGRSSNRRISAEQEQEVVKILCQDVYRGVGPALGSEYLASIAILPARSPAHTIEGVLISV